MPRRRFPTTPYGGDDEENITYSIDNDFNLNHFTGSTLVVGDTVFLSDDGVQILASTGGSYDSTHAFSFIDADRNEIGGIYGRDDAGQNVVGFRAVDIAQADENTVIEIASTSTTDAEATVTIQTNRSGESTDTYIYLERTDSGGEIDLLTPLASGRIRIAPRLNLMGASAELVDIYIKGTHFILKYNDAGTTRYKYLDLSGTGTTWTHSTTEP